MLALHFNNTGYLSCWATISLLNTRVGRTIKWQMLSPDKRKMVFCSVYQDQWFLGSTRFVSASMRTQKRRFLWRNLLKESWILHNIPVMTVSYFIRGGSIWAQILLLGQKCFNTCMKAHLGVMQDTTKPCKGLRQIFIGLACGSYVRQYIRECDVCQLQYKSENISPAWLLQPLPLPTQIWTEISMGFYRWTTFFTRQGLHYGGGRQAVQVCPVYLSVSSLHCHYRCQVIYWQCLPAPLYAFIYCQWQGPNLR